MPRARSTRASPNDEWKCTMIKNALSMLLTVALPFAIVGCVAGPTTDTEADYEDDTAYLADEPVGEAESALTVLDCCTRYDSLSSSEKIGCNLVVVKHCETDGSVPACTKTASQGGGIWMYCPDSPSQ